MYIPKLYKHEINQEVIDFVRNNSFGILVNTVHNKPWATHIPLDIYEKSPSKYVLYGHISRANQQGVSFLDDQTVLAIFNGPHAYISSSWYDHENVPTWNYIAVHIYGKLRLLEGKELFNMMKILVDKYEAKSAKPVSLEQMTPSYVEEHLRGLIGFEISIDEIQAAYKLSQNRDEKNHAEIINQLEAQKDYQAQETAKEMKKQRK